MTARPAGFGGEARATGEKKSQPLRHTRISGYETGASLPSMKTLVKIAKALKKQAGHFLDE